ncbi:hypothetical protein [Streptobacillus notomytis]|nr:hypothetical protein [Streptobacillus notomytis]
MSELITSAFPIFFSDIIIPEYSKENKYKQEHFFSLENLVPRT